MRRAYAVGMSLLVGGLFVGALLLSVGYTRHKAVESDRRWCELLAARSAEYAEAGQTAAAARRSAVKMDELRREMHCTGGQRGRG